MIALVTVLGYKFMSHYLVLFSPYVPASIFPSFPSIQSIYEILWFPPWKYILASSTLLHFQRSHHECMHMCVYIYTHIHTHANMYIHICVCVYVYIHIFHKHKLYCPSFLNSCMEIQIREVASNFNNGPGLI